MIPVVICACRARLYCVSSDFFSWEALSEALLMAFIRAASSLASDSCTEHNDNYHTRPAVLVSCDYPPRPDIALYSYSTTRKRLAHLQRPQQCAVEVQRQQSVDDLHGVLLEDEAGVQIADISGHLHANLRYFSRPLFANSCSALVSTHAS